MTENTQTLEEVTVVAVGYGDVRRRDLTGSIGSANMGDLTKTPVSNITESSEDVLPAYRFHPVTVDREITLI